MTLQKNEFRERKINVELWDPDREMMVNESAIQIIYDEPKLLENERVFEIAKVFNQPKFQCMQIIPNKGKKLTLDELLKIAASFHIPEVKINKMKCLDTGKIDYFLSYGPNSSNWNPEAKVYPTIPNDLKYDKVFCYGITTAEDYHRIHHKPIN